MNAPSEESRNTASIRHAAAEWVVRRERGLSPAEQDAFLQWLATDERHRVALAERRWAWEELDRVAGVHAALGAVPDPDLLAPGRSEPALKRRLVSRAWQAAPFVAAALLTVVVLGWLQYFPRTVPAAAPLTAARPISTALATPCEERTLEDGSRVELNRGAEISVEFSGPIRQVRLERGEANFIVAPDAGRPFVVVAGHVTARALGTTFNVRRAEREVEVVVTEGRVQLDVPPLFAPVPILTANQRALVPVAPPGHSGTAPLVADLTVTELEDRLAWQSRLLAFTDRPLAEIVAEFNRRNPVQVVIDNAALQTLRLNGAFRSDNVEGFVRLMESDFGMRATWQDERCIVLRKRP